MTEVVAARAELLDAAQAGEPGFCPCCDHWVQFYRRRFHRRLALDLLWLYLQRRNVTRKFVDVRNRKLYGRVLAPSTCDLGVLKHWGLVEAAPNDDPKKKTSGLWRITKQGIEVVRDQRHVAEYVWLYLDTVQRFDGELISFEQALRRPGFDYSELMNYTDDEWWAD